MMLEGYDPATPLAGMFDMIVGRAREIHDAATDGYCGSDAVELVELLEKSLQLLRPFAFPPAKHVIVHPENGAKCMRCGAELSKDSIFQKAAPMPAGSLVKIVDEFTKEHAACLPWLAIHEAAYNALRDLNHGRLDSTETAEQMVNSIKSILNDAKEGRL